MRKFLLVLASTSSSDNECGNGAVSASELRQWILRPWILRPSILRPWISRLLHFGYYALEDPLAAV
jgi:hypothetical protein